MAADDVNSRRTAVQRTKPTPTPWVSPLSSTWGAMVQLFFGDGDARLDLAADERLDGKTVMITGCNCGLGKAVAVQMAKLGAKIVMACRDEVPQAKDQVKQLSGSNLVEIYHVDLADFATIHTLCDTLRDQGVVLDMVVLNAAVVPLTARQSAQGLDLMLQVNYIANVVLLQRLLHDRTLRLHTSNDATHPRPRPRLIFISSEDHRLQDAIDLGKLDQFRHYHTALDLSMYSRCKLMLTTYAYELSRRLNSVNSSNNEQGKTSVGVFALCPGPMNTNIAVEAPFWLKPATSLLLWLFFRNPMDAATPVIYFAASRSMENRTQVYIHRLVEKQPAPRVTDRSFAVALWETTERILRARDARFNELAIIPDV